MSCAQELFFFRFALRWFTKVSDVGLSAEVCWSNPNLVHSTTVGNDRECLTSVWLSVWSNIPASAVELTRRGVRPQQQSTHQRKHV